MPHAFRDDERVAAEGDGNVVVPAREAPSLEMVETEFALEVLVDAFGPPPLHHDAYELPLRHSLGESRERVVGGFVLPVAPLDEQPLWVGPVVRGHHAS